jgi:hypothetical protein
VIYTSSRWAGCTLNLDRAELPPLSVEGRITSGGIPFRVVFGLSGSILIVDGSDLSTGGSLLR